MVLFMEWDLYLKILRGVDYRWLWIIFFWRTLNFFRIFSSFYAGSSKLIRSTSVLRVFSTNMLPLLSRTVLKYLPISTKSKQSQIAFKMVEWEELIQCCFFYIRTCVTFRLLAYSPAYTYDQQWPTFLNFYSSRWPGDSCNISDFHFQIKIHQFNNSNIRHDIP